jgi:hypothetical protein
MVATALLAEYLGSLVLEARSLAAAQLAVSRLELRLLLMPYLSKTQWKTWQRKRRV